MLAFYRHKHLLCLTLVFLCVCALATPPIRAATRLQADVFLWLDGRGQTSTTVLLNFIPEHTLDLRPALSQALGAKLEPVKDTSSGLDSQPWTVLARSSGVLHRNGLVFTGTFDTAPLLPALRQMGVERLVIQVVQSEAALSSCRGAQRLPLSAANGLVSSFASSGLYVYSASDTYFRRDIDILSSQKPAPLLISYGYRPQDVLNEIAPLLGVLLLAVGATLWGRGRALRAQKQVGNPGLLWFGYWRFLNAIASGLWLAWIALAMQGHIHTLINFALGVRFVLTWLVVTPLILMWPPILTIALCVALSTPVLLSTRQLDSTRSELVRQVVWGYISWMLPALLGLIGLIGLGVGLIVLMFPAPNIARFDWRVAVLLLIVAVASRLVSRRELLRAGGGPVPLQPVTEGELHQRIQELAAQAGVSIQQIQVISTQKNRQANAFATEGNGILLTDHLLQHFTRREVDAIVAHELTHLKSKHIHRLLISAVVVGVVGSLLASRFWPLLQSWQQRVPFLMLVPLLLIAWVAHLVSLFLSRRFESAADAGAVTLTGDAEAYITMLAKLTQINLLPMEWGRWQQPWLTHPSTRHRIDAVAQHAGLGPEQVETLLAKLSSPSRLDTEESYALPI